MAKERPAIPKALRDEILKEFNHRCAMCGADQPQIHHIDSDPSNNDEMNLIPLCPNCHLIDQHKPSQPLEPEKLKLFRRYKDPTILSPQFDPLFTRLRYLYSIQTIDHKLLEKHSKELVSFVSALSMGVFYSEKIRQLTSKLKHAYSFSGSERNINISHNDDEYKSKLENNKEEVISLVIELLRYQQWEHPKKVLIG